MSTSPGVRAGSAAGRRLRAGLGAVGVVLCAAMWLVLSNLIAVDRRLHVTADVTATGEHRLAPRTRQVLDSLPPGYEIIIAGASGVDRQVRRRVGDVIDAMARTGRVRITWIDEAAGPEHTALVARLVERDRAATDRAAADIAGAAAELDQAADLLERIERALRDIEQAVAVGAPGASVAIQILSEYRTVARVLGTDARAAGQAVRGSLAEETGLGVAPVDRAAATARRGLARIAGELRTLAVALTDFAAADSTPPEARSRARALAQQVSAGRDPIALAADRAAAVRIPDTVRVARVLESAQSVLVVSPTGLGALDFDALFPARVPETIGGARADVGAQAEDMLAGGLGALASPTSPIVVLAHADEARLLDQNAVNALLRRLALRRVDVVEWRLAAEPEPPSLVALDPDAVRPVVYAFLGTSSAAAASGPSGLTGPDRVQRLGAAMRRVAERGVPMLVSITPSTLPTYGGRDEAVAILHEFGLEADSGRPLLTERIAGGRRMVETDRLLTAIPQDGSDPHPIRGATASLAIGLRWVVPIRERDLPAGARVSVVPLIEAPAASTWAESQWLGYWQVPPEQRARVAQPPTPDPDMGDDVAGPWRVAWAAERRVQGITRPQRLVAVGSNGWFFDALAAQTEVVNGRVVPTLPGNAELFEASVFWLAGQEGFIARSAASGSVPTIRPLSPGEASVIRWIVLAVLPLGTLALGVLWRVARG